MTKFVKTFISAAAILTLALTLLSTPFQHAQAAGPFTVTTTADTNDASINGVCADAGGQCSLRAAIEEANQSGSPTTINVPAGTYNLVLGELSIAPNGNRTITINGAGAASTIINQTDGQNRVFNIDFFAFGATYVTINAVTISGGSDRIDSLGGAGILAGSFSSLPRDSLTLTNCIVTNNHVYQPDPTYTSQPGGGLQMAGGDLTITNCTFSNNSSAASNGGGVAYIAPDQGGTVIITGSTFSGNSVVNNTTSGPVGGGALFLTSSLSSPNTTTISNSTFNNNTVTSISSGTVYGGAILHNTGVLSIDHSVFTANAVGGAGGQGGAIYVDSGTLNLSYSRLSGNSASNGGSGLYNHSSNGAISNAANNWWGCPTGPAASPCDLAAANGANLTYTPWITLTHTASPDPIFVNQSTTLTASFLKNSAGATLTTDQVSVLLGLPVTWSNPVLGTLSAQQTTIQANGQATAAFTAGAVGGTGHADATVDHGPATASFTITPYADLAVTKSALPSVVAGENLAYTITITNNGPSAAANTVLSDTLPAGTTFFSQSQTAGSSSFTLSNTGNTISNTLASFPAGDSATFMVVVQVSAAQANGSTISNTATATSSTYEPDASDNTSTATTSVTTSADLALTKTSPATVIPGASVTYTLTLVNNGPSDAQGVSLADTLPTGLTFVSQEQTSGPAFTLTNPGNGIQNTIATLPVGASATFNVVASAGASLTGGTTLVNSASASSSTSDPDPANNSDSTTITVNIPPAITSANNVTFTVGMAGSFTVTATGYPTPALSQTGSLPSGVTFVDNGNGTATLSGTPATGTSGTYALTLTAANGVGSNATQSFTLNVADGLAITSPANTTFTIGQAGSFTVTTSGVPTPTLSLTGTLPSGVSFVDNGNGTATLSGTPTLGTVGNYIVELTAHNGVNPDASQTFTLKVEKAAATIGVLTAPNPSFYMQEATFTATVSSASGTPTGTVQFVVDTLNFGAPVSLVSGVATLTTSTLSAGSHNIEAIYSGDANFTPSASTPVSQVVLPLPTTTSLEADFRVDPLRQNPILVAVITPIPSLTTPLNGTVTFFDGVTPITTVPLDANNTATLLITGLTRGLTYNFSAQYNPPVGILPSSQTASIFVPYVQFLNNIAK